MERIPIFISFCLFYSTLGDGDFVNEVLKLSEEELTHKEELKRQGWDLARVS